MKNKDILNLYYKVQLIRSMEEKIIELYKEQEIRCPVHLSIGQEAIAAGISQALNPNDIAMSNHRSHSHYLAKGCNIKKMIFELYGKKEGCSGGKGGSMHLIDLNKNFYGSTPIVASTIPIAAGLAFAEKITRSRNTIVVIYFGDGAYESGNFHEVLNFSSLHSLKILFVCENNSYSVYSPLKYRQPKNLIISNVAKSHGIKSCLIDGNKADSIFQKTLDIRREIIQSNKPYFIELRTYRYFEHCGVNNDDSLNYRNPKVTEQWKKKCPLKYLKKKYSIHKLEFDKIELSINKKLEKYFLLAKLKSFPKKKDLSSNIYAK